MSNAIFELLKYYSPFIAMAISYWFPIFSGGRSKPLTDQRFKTALILIPLFDLLIMISFYISIVTPDYMLAETCEDYFNARFRVFMQNVMLFTSISALVLSFLFHRIE